jgi:hypothetical protein
MESKIFGLIVVPAIVFSAGFLFSAMAEEKEKGAQSAASLTFPEGTATSSDVCGGCHVAIYREFATGFGTDMKYNPMILLSPRACSQIQTTH